MSSILISLCNLPSPTRAPVLRLDLPPASRGPVKITPVNLGFPTLINSATGLTIYTEQVYVLFWIQGIFHVTALDRQTLTPIFHQVLPEVKDGHSILVSDAHLYVVSTGTDEVLRYELQDRAVGHPTVVWSASTTGTDTHHINSIVKLDTDIYVSGFGPKTDKLWSSATNGYIHNITRDVRVQEKIYHPHSLSARHGQLYYCESSTKSFSSLNGPILQLDGYTRGISWLSDEMVCICSSQGRRISKSTGLIANSADPGAATGQTGLVIRNINSHEVLFDVNLSRFGPEIYDALVLDEVGQ